ncbi:MAG: hypothetical protein IAF02_12420 [Anaerolineae bacterium]|nr:hypothetical protein [Anaerolineae bacterium]
MTLAKKLQIKPDSQILLLNAPFDFKLTELPAGCSVVTYSDDKVACVLLFAQDKGDLEAYGEAVITAVIPDGLLWIAYPKKGSGLKTDITRDEGWQTMTKAGFRPIRQIAVDETWSALRFRPAMPESDMVEVQYSGGKEHLRPIYDQLVAIVQEFGSDVVLGPRKTYVAIARKKQFCVIQPSTQTRVDVGLKLPGRTATSRLVEAGNFGSGSVTHKVAVASVVDIDEELRAWLREAYDGMA